MPQAIGKDFESARAAAKAGIKRGDPSEAKLLLNLYSAEAKRGHSFEFRRIAAMKAQIMADIASQYDPTDLSRLPRPGYDPPPVWQAGKPKEKDPLAYMKLSMRQQWAVSELRQIWEAITQFGRINAKPLDALRVDRSRAIIEPIDGLLRFSGERLALYGVWAKRQKRGVVPGLNRFQLAWRVIIDRQTTRATERLYRVRSGYLGRLFKAILNEY